MPSSASYGVHVIRQTPEINNLKDRQTLDKDIHIACSNSAAPEGRCTAPSVDKACEPKEDGCYDMTLAVSEAITLLFNCCKVFVSRGARPVAANP